MQAEVEDAYGLRFMNIFLKVTESFSKKLQTKLRFSRYAPGKLPSISRGWKNPWY